MTNEEKGRGKSSSREFERDDGNPRLSEQANGEERGGATVTGR